MSFELGHSSSFERPRQSLDQGAEQPGHILVQGMPMKVEDAAKALGVLTPAQLLDEPDPRKSIEALTPQQAQVMLQMIAAQRAQLQEQSMDLKLHSNPEVGPTAQMQVVSTQTQKLDEIQAQVQERAALAPQIDVSEAGFGELFFAPIQEIIEAAPSDLDGLAHERQLRDDEFGMGRI